MLSAVVVKGVGDMLSILEQQLKAQKEGRAVVLATVVKTQGSTPRGVGSKMMVLSDGSVIGTVGGGVLEKQVIEDALKCLKAGGAELREYENKTSESGPACGGLITVYMEADNDRPRLVVCGAGHVGGEVIRLGGILGYDITALDTRANDDIILKNASGADRFITADTFDEVISSLEISPGAFYLVSTYGHAHDAEALAAVLKKAPKYVGMMGSPGKIRAIFEKLKGQGVKDGELGMVHTPIGLDIGGETPPEIALSIMAEMQMARYGGTGKHLKEL